MYAIMDNKHHHNVWNLLHCTVYYEDTITVLSTIILCPLHSTTVTLIFF